MWVTIWHSFFMLTCRVFVPYDNFFILKTKKEPNINIVTIYTQYKYRYYRKLIFSGKKTKKTKFKTKNIFLSLKTFFI